MCIICVFWVVFQEIYAAERLQQDYYRGVVDQLEREYTIKNSQSVFVLDTNWLFDGSPLPRSYSLIMIPDIVMRELVGTSFKLAYFSCPLFLHICFFRTI